MYILKKGQPSFEMVEGSLAGHEFVPGTQYENIPAGERHRFETKKKKTAAKPVKAKEQTENA